MLSKRPVDHNIGHNGRNGCFSASFEFRWVSAQFRFRHRLRVLRIEPALLLGNRKISHIAQGYRTVPVPLAAEQRPQPPDPSPVLPGDGRTAALWQAPGPLRQFRQISTN